MPSEKASVEKVLHALGDPTRRAMVEMLSERPQSVSRLAEPFGITLTAVMQHLRILEECGLVRTEKVGRVRTASLVTSGFDALQEWISQRRTEWDMRLDRLGQLLSDEKPGT
jgi:DNA-binding transcriptional ArsR family regulator